MFDKLSGHSHEQTLPPLYGHFPCNLPGAIWSFWCSREIIRGLSTAALGYSHGTDHHCAVPKHYRAIVLLAPVHGFVLDMKMPGVPGIKMLLVLLVLLAPSRPQRGALLGSA